MSDLLDGFKEVRLNSSRSDELFDDVVEVSRKAANIKIRSQSETYRQLVFSQSAMYLLLASVVFMVPAFSDTKGGSITQVTTALMFVVGRVYGHRANDTHLAAAEYGGGQTSSGWRPSCARSSLAKRSSTSSRASGFDKIEMRDVVFQLYATNRPKPCSGWAR